MVHLARLAGLRIPSDQLPRLARDMDSLVRMISTVKDANTEGVEPFVSFAREGRNSEGSWIRSSDEVGGQQDDIKRQERGQELLKHAEKLDREYYVVKKVVPDSGGDNLGS